MKRSFCEIDRKTGAYYKLTCRDTLNGFYMESDFDGMEDAINTAIDHDAFLFWQEFKNGELITCKVLYDPTE